MSVPSPGNNSNPNTAEVVDEEWRASVQQSYRNAEVREIAKVLASLEPGSKESSKLRLAMQFEDTVFKSSTSLADYRKRLTKRLKKVQKSYIPPAQDETVTKERELHLLRQKYGDSIRYILKHSSMAIAEMKDKNGEEKANQLKQHTDGVRVWATDLGIISSTTPTNSTVTATNVKPNVNMSTDQLKKLKELLERRLENIRWHVVKLAEPDQFMAETLDKTENQFLDNTNASIILSECSIKRYEQWQKGTIVEPETLLMESLDVANQTVPLPTRTNNQKNDERIALIHLNKMRAASTAIFAYMSTRNKHTIPRHTLVKAHTVAREGIEFVQRVVHEHRKQEKPQEVTLQDAWMKPLVLQQPISTTTIASVDDEDNPLTTTTTGTTHEPPAKKIRTNQYNTISTAGIGKAKPVLRSRVLLTANHKTPTSILMALKRKRAILVRPPPVGEGSHLILDFGTAFVMYIYFVPLLVSIRAYNYDSDNNKNTSKPTDDTTRKNGSSLSSSTKMDTWKFASWVPLHHGLTNHNADIRTKDSARQQQHHEQLSVWGVKGTYDAIGSVIEERLRDCSAHATHTLRQCFAKHVNVATTTTTGQQQRRQLLDSEIEIYEASALLEFLQLARTTFIPNWEDDD